VAERPRRRGLTPLSGELRAAEPEILGRPRRRSLRDRLRRRPKPPPKTWREAIARGLARFGLIVAIFAALIVGIALVIVWRTGAELGRTVALAFLIGGVIVLAGGFASSTVGSIQTGYYYVNPDRERVVSNTFVYAAIGIVLVLIGVVVDQTVR